MTNKLFIALPFKAPHGFIEWAKAVLLPKTFDALQFDTTSALQVLAAYHYALDNPKATGTNYDRVPAAVLERRSSAAWRKRKMYFEGKLHGATSVVQSER